MANPPEVRCHCMCYMFRVGGRPPDVHRVSCFLLLSPRFADICGVDICHQEDTGPPPGDHHELGIRHREVSPTGLESHGICSPATSHPHCDPARLDTSQDHCTNPIGKPLQEHVP